MLQMALGTTADAGVKGRRLSLQQRFVVGVADDALGRLDASDRCVTGGAVIFQVCVCRRQHARLGHPLPGDRLLEGGLARGQYPQHDKKQRACTPQNSFESPFGLFRAGCHRCLFPSVLLVGQRDVIQACLIDPFLNNDPAGGFYDPAAFFRPLPADMLFM